MVSKAVTHQDLQNIKSEIKDENMKDRHNLDNKLTNYFFKVDELNVDNALTKQAIATMNKNFEELKNIVTEWFSAINEKFDKVNEKFVTKEEHEKNVTKIWNIEKVVDWINMKIVYATGAFSIISEVFIFALNKFFN